MSRPSVFSPSPPGRAKGEGRETVVLVHGLWLTGLESIVLRRRLRALHYEVRQFRYRTVSASLEDNAGALHDFIAGLDTAVVHLVGHSLGGLVILRAVERFADLPPGRVVLLGSPVAGSRAAAGFARHGWGRRMLGRSVADGVLELPVWRAGGRDIGVIAGSLGIGLGCLWARLDEPHDGTVMVAETRLTDATAHRVLPVTHFGLLFSRDTAAEVAHFLELGRFT